MIFYRLSIKMVSQVIISYTINPETHSSLN